MTYVAVIIIFCSLPAGLGVIIDRLLLNRHKGRLHNTLLRYWLHLEELSLPDIWRVFADYAIRFFTRIFGRKFLSFRCIITIILVSFCLTFCALVLGFFLDMRRMGLYVIFTDIILPGMPRFLSINLVFDTLTGLVTVKVLSVIRRSTPGKAIVFIVIDITLAFFLAIACYSFGDVFPTTISRFIYDPYLKFVGLLRRQEGIAIAGIFYACTTFIPTFIYMSILATLILSKAILGIGIRITKYLLETATEVKDSKDLAVFTLTGSLFSVIVLFLTSFMGLHEIFSK